MVIISPAALNGDYGLAGPGNLDVLADDTPPLGRGEPPAGMLGDNRCSTRAVSRKGHGLTTQWLHFGVGGAILAGTELQFVPNPTAWQFFG